jgi:hypothetical protein
VKKFLIFLISLLLMGCATLDLNQRVDELEKKYAKVGELEKRFSKAEILAATGAAGANFYPARDFTGGAAGDLDNISGTADGDVGFVVVEGHGTYGDAMFVYVLDATSGDGDDAGAPPSYFDAADNNDGAGGNLERWELADVYKDVIQTLTNKTFDANATGNVLKKYSYLVLTKPDTAGTGVTFDMDDASPQNATAGVWEQALFDDATDKATNWVEYNTVVPPDIDTTVDLVAYFKFSIGGADSGDHLYIISMESVADSSSREGTVANAVNLSYSPIASPATKDMATTDGDSLTDWKSNVTGFNKWIIRVARDGDDAVDTSTDDSWTQALIIRYGVSQ